MTPTATPVATFVHAATLLVAHLADHSLPEPASLSVSTGNGHSEVTAQLHTHTVPGIAVDLLAWADTLNMVTVEAWRPPHGDRVHLSILSTLTGPTGAVELRVFSATNYDPHRFADLQAGDQQTVCLEQLRTWAASATGAPVLNTHPVDR